MCHHQRRTDFGRTSQGRCPFSPRHSNESINHWQHWLLMWSDLISRYLLGRSAFGMFAACPTKYWLWRSFRISFVIVAPLSRGSQPTRNNALWSKKCKTRLGLIDAYFEVNKSKAERCDCRLDDWTWMWQKTIKQKRSFPKSFPVSAVFSRQLRLSPTQPRNSWLVSRLQDT